MRHTELSREALAVLELVPAWTRRAPYAPQEEAGFKTPFLAIVVGGDERVMRLWSRIAESMARVGFHSDWIAQALVLSSVQAEQLLDALSERRPRVVLVFGKATADVLMAQDANLIRGIEWVIAPALHEMLTSGAAKFRLWSLLCAIPAKVVPIE